MRLRTIFASVCMLSLAFSAKAEALRTEIVPDGRASLFFTESEPVKAFVKVNGGSGPAHVEWRVKETCGDWSAKGSLEIGRKGEETAEASLSLTLPERGHYTLDLSAKCGMETAKASNAIAVIFKARPASPESLWGIMYGGYTKAPPGTRPEDMPANIAENMRMLGASWTRLTLWEGMYKVKVDGANVDVDLSKLRRQVYEFRKRGINIMGEFVMTPRTLSSQPYATETSGDAGPLYCRVKPADYRLWDQMVEKTAAEFREDIDVWEIWNEIDTPNAYWSGTKEEFLELAKRTEAAIRKGNPSAKIAAPGFTGNIAFCKPFLAGGLGKGIDILSVHYIDMEDRGETWLNVEKEYGLNLPLWDTEESSVAPLNNIARGIRSFKFLHAGNGVYLTLQPLMKENWRPEPIAVSYSVAAHLIGTKKFQREKTINGFKVYFFGDNGELAAVRMASGASKLLQIIDRVSIKATPADGAACAGIDSLGREHALPGGSGEMPFSFMGERFKLGENLLFADPDCVFIEGCKDIASIEAIQSNAKIITVEAESGIFPKNGVSISSSMSFSNGKFLNMHSPSAPDGKGYFVDLKLTVPAENDYKVFFSGNGLRRLGESISTFVWSFDNMPENAPDGKSIKVLGGFPGATEGLSELGTVHLTKGSHVFHLRLTAPRKYPDTCWALWFDAIALVPAENPQAAY